MSGANEEDIRSVDHFRDGLLAMAGGLEGIIEAAERSKGCPLLQVYAAVFFLYAGTEEGIVAAIPWLDQAEKVLANATDRERLLYAAARRWSQRDTESTIDLLEQITREFPRDLAAAKACEFNYYITGQHHQGPRFLAQMERLMPHNREQADAVAMFAFALDLTGHYKEARAEAEKAIDLRFENAWAHHALAHVAIMTDDFERGLAEQERFRITWRAPGASIHGHNGWHLALFRLQAGDIDGVMQLFRDLIWGHMPESTGEQVDAISILWRMELAGQSVDEALWNEVADACMPLIQEALVPFVVAHHGYALARAAFGDPSACRPWTGCRKG